MQAYSDLNSRVIKDYNEERHFHPELEVLYIVTGEADVTIEDMRYQMEKHDVIAVNPGLPHTVKSSEGSVVCSVTYSSRMLAETLGSEYGFFECNSVCGNSPYYGEVGNIMEEIICEFLRHSRKTQCRMTSLLYQLLDCLTEQFMQAQTFISVEGDEDARYRKVLGYVNRNFQTSISLSDLAAQMYLSSSALSRFFKKKSGMYFVDYVNHVRVRYASQELIYSEKNITKIAVDSGFSNLSVFNRAFRDITGLTPTDYRKQKQELYRRKGEETERIAEQTLLGLRDSGRDTEEENRKHTGLIEAAVDVSQGKEYRKNWNRAINVGAISALLIANIQFHVLYLQENLKFRYIRIWNIFSKKLMITDGEHTGSYNYDQMDTALDFLVSHHLIPWFDMGVRPDTAVKTEGVHVYFDSECIEFKSREAWEAMCADFVRHIVSRYGAEEVSKWIFEMSCDVTHIDRSRCYRDEHYHQYNAYRYLFRTLKDRIPDIRVGVSMAAPDILEYLEEVLKRSKEENCVPDFTSVVLFPYVSYRKKEKITYRRDTYRNSELNQISMIRSLLQKLDIDCGLYISEWNNTVSNRNYLNDSCFRAAYLVHKIRDIWDSVDMTAVWMATDWVSNYFDTPGIANGGSGLLTKNTICKPAYYALSFLNRMGDILVGKGPGYIVTRTRRGSYYVLLYNYKWYSSNYFMEQEDFGDPEKISGLFENNDPLEIRICLENIREDAEYIIKSRSVSPKKGSLLGEWKNFGYSNDLTENDVKYIRQGCYPRMLMNREYAEKGRLRIQTVLNPHEVTLIHIYKAE